MQLFWVSFHNSRSSCRVGPRHFMVIDMFWKCPSDLTCVHVLLHCEIRFLETIEDLDNDITLHLDLEGCMSQFFIIYIITAIQFFT